MSETYHGYRIEGGVFDFIEVVRPTLDAVRDDLDAGLIARQSLLSVDRALWAGRTPLRDPITDFLVRYADQQADLPAHHAMRDMHGLQVQFFRDTITGDHLIRLFTRQPRLREAILEHATPFSWWNNADPPQDVPAEEFAARVEVWRRVIPDPYAPARTSVLWELRANAWDVNPELIPDPEAAEVSPVVLANAPEPLDRARRLVDGELDSGRRDEAVRVIAGHLPDVAVALAPGLVVAPVDLRSVVGLAPPRTSA